MFKFTNNFNGEGKRDAGQDRQVLNCSLESSKAHSLFPTSQAEEGGEKKSPICNTFPVKHCRSSHQELDHHETKPGCIL